MQWGQGVCPSPLLLAASSDPHDSGSYLAGPKSFSLIMAGINSPSQSLKHRVLRDGVGCLSMVRILLFLRSLCVALVSRTTTAMQRSKDQSKHERGNLTQSEDMHYFEKPRDLQ